MNEVPLICDPPPGGIFVITCDRVLSEAEGARLRAACEKAKRGGVLILDRGLRLEHIGGAREWPDAEFCAA